MLSIHTYIHTFIQTEYLLNSPERNNGGVVSVNDLQDIALDTLIDIFRGTVFQGFVEYILLHLRCSYVRNEDNQLQYEYVYVSIPNIHMTAC